MTHPVIAKRVLGLAEETFGDVSVENPYGLDGS